MVLVLGGTVVTPKQLEAAEQLNNTAWYLTIQSIPYGPYEKPKTTATRTSSQNPTKIIKVESSYQGYEKWQLSNCWQFVKSQVIQGTGFAKNHPINSKIPTVGAVMISYEGYTGHYAKVLAVFRDEFVVGEFNYKHGYYTERVIPNNYKLIKGFYL